MKTRWLVLSAAVVAVGAFVLARTEGPSTPSEPLAAAPSGASIVARIDVGAVTSSHLWNALLEEDPDERGVRRIERACGYDPLEQVDEAIVFATGTTERPFEHVGFLARGEMARGEANRRRLVECVSAVVGDRGGALRRVEVEGEPAVASASGGSHAAFLGADGVVGGDREVVASAIRVARGDAPSAANDATLRRLWERVSSDRDVVVVARLPDRWLPALRRMSRSLAEAPSALGDVRAIGVGVRVRGGLAIAVAAETASEAGARRLEEAVTAQSDALLDEPLLRLSALGRALRRLEVESRGRELLVTLSLTNAQIDELLALWRELRSAPAPAAEAAARTPEAGGAPGPTGAGDGGAATAE